MENTPTPPYKLGFALSGGGARGFAHLGALKALEEENIRPDVISGTSVGSLVAVFYADGYTASEILKIASTIKFTSIIEGSLPKGGFFKTTGIQQLLKKHLRAKRFEDLKIPVRVIASDIEHGTSRTFSSGDIIPAVMASCSVPVLFIPVEVEGLHYVDGGLLKNFPVSVVREECERVLGINISPVISMQYDGSLRYVIERIMNCMVGANTTIERELCDYLIESDEISEYGLFDFKHSKEIYQKGYDMTHAYLNVHKELMMKHLQPTPPQPIKKKGIRHKLMNLLFPKSKR